MVESAFLFLFIMCHSDNITARLHNRFHITLHRIELEREAKIESYCTAEFCTFTRQKEGREYSIDGIDLSTQK